MGRLPRPTGDDLIYHAINRGNNRADVLGPDGERDMFLGDLARTKARYPFALFGYCLMSNHFHLLLKPAPGQSISRILRSLTVAHTWRRHRRQGTSGRVWPGRFRSPVIQEKGNPVSRIIIRCRVHLFSFSPEKINRHRITRKDELNARLRPIYPLRPRVVGQPVIVSHNWASMNLERWATLSETRKKGSSLNNRLLNP